MSSKHEIIKYGLNTLDCEILALQKLKGYFVDDLSEKFTSAVEMIIATTGHVIVTGVGKSGLIGAKIASTMSSTGTPAFFVHPGDASHGDLGTITNKDVLIAISHSGESSELVNIYKRAKTIGVKIIGITSVPTSAVAIHSDLALVLPAVKEACPFDAAPTSSTTIQLAIGDALAISCLQYKEFKVHDFRELHPGGSLGARLSRVADIMHQGDTLPLVGVDVVMSAAMDEMNRGGFGCVGTVNSSGELVGIITDGDIRRNISEDLLARCASDIMSLNPLVIDPNMGIVEAKELMHQKEVTSLFVTAGAKPMGIVHMHDFARIK